MSSNYDALGPLLDWLYDGAHLLHPYLPGMPTFFLEAQRGV